MKDEFSHRKHRSKLSRPRRREGEEIVKSGLALTPAQMDYMVQHGQPIAPQNLGITYEEGVDKQRFDVPPQYKRGVDIGDLWEARESVNKRFKKGVAELQAAQSVERSE